MRIASFFSYAREYLFPAACAVCGGALLSAEDAYYGLCADCRPCFLRAADGGECCFQCGRPLISEKSLCMRCRKDRDAGLISHCDRIVSVFPYTSVYCAVLHAYKFDKRTTLARLLADRLLESAAALLAIADTGAAVPVFVPVPPRPGKIKKTGWDQIAFLARFLERMPARDFPPALQALYPNGLRIARCLKR